MGGNKGVERPTDFQQYLKEFPQGCYRDVAKFRIRSLVPELATLQVDANFVEDQWRSGKQAEWVDFDGGRSIELIRIRPAADDGKILVEYTCNSAGYGESSWVSNWELCHPRGPRPMQNFQVRLRGNWSDFYDLIIKCSTREQPSDSKRDHGPVVNGGSCGVAGGTTRTFLYRIWVEARRKPSFN